MATNKNILPALTSKNQEVKKVYSQKNLNWKYFEHRSLKASGSEVSFKAVGKVWGGRESLKTACSPASLPSSAFRTQAAMPNSNAGAW